MSASGSRWPGPIDPLVKALARFEVLDLQSREPSLEEIFLTFYGGAVTDRMGSVFSKTLREQRRALAWWAIGLVGGRAC